LIENRNISINVIYPGASPQEMEEGIILKIEDNLKGIVGIDRFTSTSKENSANILIEVLKGYNIDAALSDIKNAVNKIPSFPTNMEPPIIAKQIFTSDAISIVLSGENIPLMTLKSFGRKVEDDLRSFEGISQINVSGYPDEEIEIALNEDKMRAYQLTFQEIAAAVTSTNILVTGGSIKTSQEEYLIRVSNRKYYGVEFDQIILKSNENGKLIRLQDIAVITDKWSESPDRAYFNGKPSVQLNVKATISEDLIEVAENVKAYVTDFNNKNDNLQLAIISDRSVVVVERINLLLKNALQGIILVLIFLALFLKPRLAFWVAFGLPFAFLGMFIFAGFFNVTINIVSLFGMIIVIGILVDDGIVISENIYHHYEKGKTRMQAAIDGTMEVLPAITSAILTTLVAFSSFFFLEGRIGEFFGETATIVILTLGLSLIEALIILPSHISHSKSLTKAQKNLLVQCLCRSIYVMDAR
jgi:multidrug efflux pump subunit AcrB